MIHGPQPLTLQLPECYIPTVYIPIANHSTFWPRCIIPAAVTQWEYNVTCLLVALLASAPLMATSVSQPAAECSAQLTIKGAFLNAIGKVNILAPLALSTFPHCLSTNNDKGYGGIGGINFACTRVKAARVVVITAVTDYAT